MLLPDVNVLIEAFRTDSAYHRQTRAWLEDALRGSEPLGLSDLVLSGFVRVVTNHRIYADPNTIDEALDFANALREERNVSMIRPGPRHWEAFERLCREVRPRGPLVPDAYHAALAIESGCEWVTFDRDFARFPGLRWRHPLAAR